MNGNHIKSIYIKGIGCISLLSILMLSACSSDSSSSIDAKAELPKSEENTIRLTAEQFNSSQMEIAPLEMVEFSNTIKANGMFDVPPENKATVSSYFGGTVKDIKLLPGQPVKKGQMIFTLESPEYVQLQQDYLEAKGQLKYLKSDFERQENLIKDNVTSQKNYLKAESDYTVTKVKAESLAKKLLLMNINPEKLTMENIRTSIYVLSPINGFVTSVNITKGTYLNPSETAITIIDTGHLHLELNIFERDLPFVKIGQPISFSIQEDKSNTYHGTVHLINKAVDPESRMINIHGHLVDEEFTSAFSPGMYVEAQIATSSEKRAALPKEAIVEIDDHYYVLARTTNNSYQFKKQEVKIGASNHEFIEITNAEDFKSNTQFLVKGAFNLITD
ncbi:efflux RND transporter periplasmic adaptor subunit [Fulvivirga maritima]|uniref:efflux RND transporter periplasmic adaptor subunit n=1 Tax=Fulvivirga maritima TaxID=2904247 RepID=UPI001F1BA4F9|nr:efflux RND transporter periplasmic adaptor subunit [Fulvivirga maritima]UII26024.1 efflux RND transporter periplasmic adaptor subunit [Fulvivirga maritima]